MKSEDPDSCVACFVVHFFGVSFVLDDPFLFPALVEGAPGVYCGTFFVSPNPALEYKFIVTNGGQIINEEQFAPDEPCTTTPFGFTNRVLEVIDSQLLLRCISAGKAVRVQLVK